MPVTCQLVCEGFRGTDPGKLGKFLGEALGLVTKGRPVWVEKKRESGSAHVRFTGSVDVSQLSALLEGKLVYKDVAVKCALTEGDEDVNIENPTKKQKQTDVCITDLVLPLLSRPYDQQLLGKQKQVEEVVASALGEVRKSAKARGYFPLPEWGALEVESTLHAADISHYRNKCEFAFGRDSEGRAEVGFTLRRATMTAEPAVAPGEDLPHVSAGIAKIVKSIKIFFTDNLDEFPLFSHVSKCGCWRVVLVRVCPRTCASQVVVQVGVMGETSKKEKLQFLLTCWGKTNSITSLFVQFNGSFTDSFAPSEQHELVLLHGPSTIPMAIGPSLTMEVHPYSFFQTNTAVCELLYEQVASLLSSPDPCTIFDVCCGVGSIGMFVAKRSASPVHVVGVDIVDAAIEDARMNACKNGLENTCTYVAGRAESVLAELIDSTVVASPTTTKYMCVVDPPRSGLHKSVIRAIRECEQIQRLVYVSCNPKSLAADLAKFCEPLVSCPDEEGHACNMRFEPRVARAVDMFPHTPHCEVVVLLERRRNSN